MNEIHYGGSCGHVCCLRVENLGVRIGSTEILKDINMHVHCGQMVALIGPNGAGKSTFLKAILGQREYSGVIAFSEPANGATSPESVMCPRVPALTLESL